MRRKSVLSRIVSHFLGSPGRAYLVGGWVRDALLGARTCDIDIAVENNEQRVARAVAKSVRGALTLHPKFMTASITTDHFRIDIARTRTETYATPGALPTVKPAAIWDDLQRRDFTMNALALGITPDNLGELYDPCQGVNDIGRGLVRVIHDRSFEDDPTRVFRALRYKNRLGFRLERTTEKLLRRAINEGRIQRLTGARIRHELELICAESTATKTIADIARYRILPLSRRVARELPHYGEHAWIMLAAQPGMPDLCLSRSERRLADAIRTLPAVRARLRRSRSASAVYRVLKDLPEPLLPALSHLDPAMERAVHTFRELRCRRPLITGRDLLRLGYRPGPRFRRLLEIAFQRQLDGHIRRKRDLLEGLRR